MLEFKLPCMEHEPRRGLLGFFSVDGIAVDRSADVMEVDADLMGASGVKVALNEGGLGLCVGGQDLVVGDRGLSAGRVDNGHLLAVDRMATDMGEDRVTAFRGDPVGYGEVDLLHRLSLGKLGDEALVSRVGFRDDQTAGSVFVEAVDDAGSLDPAYTGELAFAVVKERVDESSLVVPRGRVNHHAVFFVEDEEVFVLEEDFQGNVLGRCFGGNGLRYRDRDQITSLHRVPGFCRAIVEKNVLISDQALDSGA